MCLTESFGFYNPVDFALLRAEQILINVEFSTVNPRLVAYYIHCATLRLNRISGSRYYFYYYIIFRNVPPGENNHAAAAVRIVRRQAGFYFCTLF